MLKRFVGNEGRKSFKVSKVKCFCVNLFKVLWLEFIFDRQASTCVVLKFIVSDNDLLQ